MNQPKKKIEEQTRELFFTNPSTWNIIRDNGNKEVSKLEESMKAKIDWVGLSYGMQKPVFSFNEVKALRGNIDFKPDLIISPEAPYDLFDACIHEERTKPNGLMTAINQLLNEIQLAQTEAAQQTLH